MEIIKANGVREEFKESKLRESLMHAGADDKTIDFVVKHILSEIKDGDTTQEIYRHAYEILRKEAEKPTAARYSLKRALMELGPSGFPFENFLEEVYRIKGYESSSNVHINGKCVSHEFDVVASNSNELILIEAKFHNQAGAKTDVKVALYMRARYEDVMENDFGGRLKEGQSHTCMIMTNTGFTKNAWKYSNCADLDLVSWSHPEKNSLQDLIESTALHPVTALSTLSIAQKNTILESGKVLCRDIKNNPEILKNLGLDNKKEQEVMDEVNRLCVPRNGS